MFSLMRGSIPNASAEPVRVVEQAKSLGAAGVTFYSLFELSASLDPGELAELSTEAKRLNIRIDASLDWLNPLRIDRQGREIALGGGDFVRGVIRLLEIGADLGMDQMFFTIGTLEDRERNWPAQLDAVADTLSSLRAPLRDLGMRLLVKTHEEITSREAIGLAERVGPDVLGISFDPVNLLVRLENPMAAVKRLAPYVIQIHIDDAILKLEGDQGRRYLSGVGEGVLDWAALLQALPSTVRRLVELHRGQFAVPIFDRDWLAKPHEVSLTDYAWFIERMLACGDREPIAQDDVALRLPRAIDLAATT